ncbi:MAG: dual specificity protein phosphatase family protein [Gammaproteobacteria bacterium]|nr:dual specificity protein phosphatase family protein [Gammaproteobacteria bacterium]
MKHVFWLRKGKVAGRSGPNQDWWDLDELKSHGFSAILSVNNGDAVHGSLISGLGIVHSTIPMSSNAPVRDGDKELCLNNLPKTMAFIRNNLKNGPVLIHCRSGKDRTGMVLATYLIEFEGYGAKEAMDAVLEVRPIAFSAEGWKDFGIEVLRHYETHNKHLQSGLKTAARFISR